MRVYVAGSLSDVALVRQAQEAVRSAGHEIVLDWTRGPDSGLTDYESDPATAAAVARADLAAVLDADAVLLVLTETPGVGMFVELGAALASGELGAPKHVAVIGPDTTTSVFFFHPAVRRYGSVHDWLGML